MFRLVMGVLLISVFMALTWAGGPANKVTGDFCALTIALVEPMSVKSLPTKLKTIVPRKEACIAL